MKYLFLAVACLLGMFKFLPVKIEQKLSAKSEDIIKSISEDVEVSFYFSRSTIKKISMGREINMLADNIRKVFVQVSRINSKIKFNYYEPLPFSDVYLKGIGKGLKTLPMENNADFIFGVIFESKRARGFRR